MFRTLRIAAISTLVGLGSLTAMPASAQADGFYFSFGSSGPRAGASVNHGGRYHARQHRQRHVAARSCTPRHAVRKAQRLGIQRARVVGADRRIIRVSGRKHHRPVSMVFARAPRCPVIY